MRGVIIMLKIEKTADLCAITKRVVDDFNHLTDKEFFRKYSVSKMCYLKRFKRYGDPYMNAPLARFSKWITKRKK